MVSKQVKEKKYEMVIRRSKEVISKYTDKLTIRQLYYRLVANNDIPNNRSQYNYFDKILTEYRQKNLDFADYFDDKTRKIISNIETYNVLSFSKKIKAQINSVKNDYPYYWTSRNRLQKQITVILLEKQALETIFQKAIGSMSILVVARGFNSFTQMKELMDLVKDDERELHLYTFTDYDDSGLLIEKNFIRQTKEYLGIEFDSIERIALTKELVEKNNFPTNPTKNTTHSQFNLPYFVELDAIEPNMLKDMVKEVCERHFDKGLYRAITKAFDVRNRRLKKRYFKELRKISFSDLT